MSLDDVKKQWKYYIEEFNSSEYMDIDSHVETALLVGGLLDHIETLEKLLKNKES